MKWLTEWCLGGFVLAVVGHLTGSMGFYTLGYGLAALVVLRVIVPMRPAAPTPGLGFILLAVGGLGGWFGIEEVAIPGSWPMLFKVFAGICLGALTLLLWQFFARKPEQSTQPLQPATQNTLVIGLLLLLLTPLASEPGGLHGGQAAMSYVVWLQQAGVLLAVVGFSLAKQHGRVWRWLLLLLPPLLAVPLTAKLLLLVRRPLMMAMWVLAPSFSGGNVGFTPLQYLDHHAFLQPSSKVVMRVRAEQLPSPYLVGNRVSRFAAGSLSWEALREPLQANAVGNTDNKQTRFELVVNHNGDFVPDNLAQTWSMTVTSLRWDSLVFLPPQAGEVQVEASDLTSNLHQVWSAKFDDGASKTWTVLPGSSTPDSVRPEYLELPEFWDQPLQAQAESYADPERRRVVTRIREDFFGREYSLSVDLDPGKPFQDFFLNRRPGYCFWFATAGALSLRANGIPSRVVSGYYINEKISHDVWLVRERDAHSWVEWQDEAGYWHTFDPTPPSIGLFQAQYQGSALGRWLHLLRERVNQVWARFDLSEQIENVAIVVGFLILIFLFVREYLRIREVATTGASSDAARKWRKLWCKFIAISGLPDQRHWTAERYLQALPDSWSVDQQALASEFLRYYQGARFAPTEPDIDSGKALLVKLRRLLKKGH
ncbi:MAG: hypothetical protein DRQ52_11415 [Gammaproteobacteria bacterium]|nr:MAG: hypothetical protein DRQ52_11415 [Gammaproteobacteria bacterium]